MIMRKTPCGTVTAMHEHDGISFGLYRKPTLGSLEGMEDGLVLYLNDDNLAELGVKVVHTDVNWVPKED